MNIAIIEDDKIQREALLSMVRDWLSREAPTGSVRDFEDAERFRFAHAAEAFDLLLVDIHLPGASGMEMVESLREKGNETAVVFITGEKEFVFQGYKVSALDYILKPAGQKELNAVLDKAKKQLATKAPMLILEQGGILKEISVDAIRYLEVLGHVSTLFYSQPGKPVDAPLLEFSSRESLQVWQERLEEVAGEGVFISPHRSFLVHMGWVSRIGRDELKLADGFLIPIARGRWEAVSKAWLAYRREQVQ